MQLKKSSGQKRLGGEAALPEIEQLLQRYVSVFALLSSFPADNNPKNIYTQGYCKHSKPEKNRIFYRKAPCLGKKLHVQSLKLEQAQNSGSAPGQNGGQAGKKRIPGKQKPPQRRHDAPRAEGDTHRPKEYKSLISTKCVFAQGKQENLLGKEYIRGSRCQQRKQGKHI